MATKMFMFANVSSKSVMPFVKKLCSVADVNSYKAKSECLVYLLFSNGKEPFTTYDEWLNYKKSSVFAGLDLPNYLSIIDTEKTRFDEWKWADEFCTGDWINPKNGSVFPMVKTVASSNTINNSIE